MPDLSVLSTHPVQYLLAVVCGALTGFVLGLMGGGGSLLATPLLLYVVGLDDVHAAIGTASFTVALNAVFGTVHNARHGLVSWNCACVFAAVGIVAAFAGSTIGQQVDGRALLGCYAALILIVAGYTMIKRNDEGIEGAGCHRGNAHRVTGFAAGTGLLSGFFGIGGGFLIVPGLVGATGLPIARAMTTSLVVVSALGATTAVNYAVSGKVIWGIGLAMLAGGLAGSSAGTRLNRSLRRHGAVLNLLLVGALLSVAATIIVKIT